MEREPGWGHSKTCKKVEIGVALQVGQLSAGEYLIVFGTYNNKKQSVSKARTFCGLTALKSGLISMI